ncbi:MAG: malate dehydrogenase [Gammaproteobacteria bacterium RIFCSPHIGHO2_12_FULL_41_15]|nr:MAG: malate dehydrogenase [Gammaproteobacteria bacterium RIFCSPHIGHO2_12_FULL_41_15]
MSNVINLAVTGAAGQIGYQFLFRAASGQAFGADTKIRLQLLELPQTMDVLKGVVMELEDCAFPLLQGVQITSDPKIAFKDANWSVLIGAVPRKTGMERSDLLKINGAIFTAQGRAINDYAAPNARVFVVGNPCNTNALIAMNNAPDMSQDRFFAMTMLDQNRAQTQLAIKAGVGIDQVKNIIVWGNHSATQFPDYFHATIAGKPATEVIADQAWFSDYFLPTIQQRGAAVIKARGLSSAASAANGAIDSLYALTHDAKAPYSVCMASKGEYGVDEGLIFSFPCITEAGQCQIVKGVTHTDALAKEKFQATLNELRAERDAVRELELIK